MLVNFFSYSYTYKCFQANNLYGKLWDTGVAPEGFVLRQGQPPFRGRDGGLQSIKHVCLQAAFQHHCPKTGLQIPVQCSQTPALLVGVRNLFLESSCRRWLSWGRQRLQLPWLWNTGELKISAFSGNTSPGLLTDKLLVFVWCSRKPCVISAVMPLQDFLYCLCPI